jgi:hypothetical protein
VRPPGRAIFLISGALGGLLFGWLIFGEQAPHPGPVGPTPGPTNASPPDVLTPRPDRSTWAQRHPPLPSTEHHAEAGDAGSEVQQLRARVAELERGWRESKLATFKVGSPVKPPEHLDSRFEGETIRMALNAAIKAAPRTSTPAPSPA